MVFAQAGSSPRKWNASNSLGLWDTNRLPNPGHLVDFAVPMDHRVKMKESKTKETNTWISPENRKSYGTWGWQWGWQWYQLQLVPLYCIAENDNKVFVQKCNLLLFFFFYYQKYMHGYSKRGSKMAEVVHTKAEVWLCSEITSAFLLHTLLLQVLFKAISRHQIILVFPRFSTLQVWHYLQPHSTSQPWAVWCKARAQSNMTSSSCLPVSLLHSPPWFI